MGNTAGGIETVQLGIDLPDHTNHPERNCERDDRDGGFALMGSLQQDAHASNDQGGQDPDGRKLDVSVKKAGEKRVGKDVLYGGNEPQ